MTDHHRTTLLIIDPQNDFVHRDGALSVPGAEEDAGRLAQLIKKAGSRITSIKVSLDSHYRVDISHPLWFFNDDGQTPDPFTVITAEDLAEQRWHTKPDVTGHTLAYLRDLEEKGRYPHVIWPEHCLIGSEGHAIFPDVQDAIYNWNTGPSQLEYVFKGMNPLTEHFSAIEAEIPIPLDPHTQANRALIENLVSCDELWVAGWARSHCVGSTLRDIYKWGGRSLAEKIVLVSDTMSDVPGFEEQGEAVTREALDLGARVTDVASLLS